MIWLQSVEIGARNFYDVYREYTFMKHSVDDISGGVYKDCPACDSQPTAMHYDGNHKLFRYKKR